MPPSPDPDVYSEGPDGGNGRNDQKKNQNGVGVREREFIMNATPLRTVTPSTRGGKTPGWHWLAAASTVQ